jgi:hypothetical protein
MRPIDAVCPHCGFDFPLERPDETRLVHGKWADITLIIGQGIAVLLSGVSIISTLAGLFSGDLLSAVTGLLTFFLFLALFVVFGRCRDIRPGP